MKDLWKRWFLTPHKGVDTSKYASDTFRGLHEILQKLQPLDLTDQI